MRIPLFAVVPRTVPPLVVGLALLLAGCGTDAQLATDPLRPLAAIGTATGGTAAGATIETSQDDYLPGEIVHLTLRGWAPNEQVHLLMTEEPDTHEDVTAVVTVDATGYWDGHFYDVEEHDLGVTFTLTGTGLTSGSVATVVFTDGTVSLLSTSPVSGVMSYAKTSGTSCTSTAFTTAASFTTANETACWEVRAPTTTVVAGATWAFTGWTFDVTTPGQGGRVLVAHTTGTDAGNQWIRFVTTAAGAGGDVTANYEAEAVSTDQTITWTQQGPYAFGAGSFALTASASSGLDVTYASQTESVCTVSGNTATIVAAGTCTIRASQAGNATYNPAPDVDQDISIGKADQTISFPAIGPYTYNTDADFNVAATATSGLAVTFASQTTDVCTISGASVTILTAGTCTIRASQSGDDDWNMAPDVDRDITINKATQTISWNQQGPYTYGDAPFALIATATSGLTVAFASQTPLVCTVSGATATILAAGTCTIRASQAGNGNWNAATDVDQSITINKANQTITWVQQGPYTFGAAPFGLTATATSGLDVSYASQTLPVCTVSGATATIVAAGTCSIRASQVGDGNWNPAPEVDQNIIINPASTTTTITVSPGAQQYSDSVVFTATIAPARVANSDLAGTVQFKVNGADVGSPVLVTCDYAGTNTCTAQLRYKLVAAAGGPVAGSGAFTSTNPNFAGSATSTPANVTVTAEQAQVYEVETSPSQILAGGSVTISFKVRELLPDVTTLPGPGDIDLANVSVAMEGVLSPGTKPACTVGSGAGNGGSGYDRIRSFTCTATNLEADTYDVSITVNGGYYTGGGAVVVQVTDPSAGFATGGGWFLLDGDRVNFGFMAKATVNRNKTVYQGSLLMIRHKANGDLVRIKSNVFDGYSIKDDEVTFTGRANYSVNGTSMGNNKFTGYGQDLGEPGVGTDRFGMLYQLNGNEIATAANAGGLKASAKVLGGGNIQVPQPQG